MQPISRFFLFPVVLASAVLGSSAMFVAAAQAQDQDADAPSLGNVARQARQQKQQKDAPVLKDSQPGDAQAQSTSGQNVADPNGTGAQNKDTASKDGKQNGPTKASPSKDAQLHRASHVITNDELPAQAVAVVRTPASGAGHGDHEPDPAFGGKVSSDEVRSTIQQQKSAIAAFETQIKALNDSIHFAGANCVSNCVEWNEGQQAKQRQVNEMRSELENAKQALEQMQDYARKMGFGGSVYEPEQ